MQLTEEYLVKHIYIEAEFLSGDTRYPEKAAFSEGTEYPQVYELQKELEDFYQVEKKQIEIVVRE